MDNDSLQQIQELEQAVHTHTVQRQSYEAQLHEIENAREELRETDEAYRIVGGIMVKSRPGELLEELEERHATVTRRITQLQQQEEKIRAQMEQLRKQLLGDTDE